MIMMAVKLICFVRKKLTMTNSLGSVMNGGKNCGGRESLVTAIANYSRYIDMNNKLERQF